MTDVGISDDFSLAPDGDQSAVRIQIDTVDYLSTAKEFHGRLEHTSNGGSLHVHYCDYTGLGIHNHHTVRDETLHHADHGTTSVTFYGDLTLHDGSVHSLSPITHDLIW